MFWLFLLGLIALIIYSNTNKKNNQQQIDEWLSRRNNEWVNFVASYQQVAHSAKEKALLARMLSDIKNQNLGYVDDSLLANVEANEVSPTEGEQGSLEPIPAVPAAAPIPASAFEALAPSRTKEQIQLDNTSLLLYFGAFLLVASVGLFIAFGGAEAHVRTFSVFVVMAVLYYGGVWLFQNRPKLRQAGVAFSAVGIVIAPLVGMAAYAYIFNQSHGPAVWMATSALCLVLYAHALTIFRQPLLSYVLIATFLSLFESGVHIVDTPVYYLAWGLALCGILLSAANRWKHFWPELQEPSRVSSQIVVPLGIAGGLALVPSQGMLQFGISLLLATIYYGIEASAAKGKERQDLILASHLLGLLSITTITFGISHRLFVAGLLLGAVNLIQLVVVYAARRQSPVLHQAADVLVASSVAAVVLTETMPHAFTAALIQTVIINMFIWLRQKQALAYGVASLAWLALPVQIGQMLLVPHLTGLQQTLFSLGALTVLAAVYAVSRRAEKQVVDWRIWALSTYHIGVAAVLISSLYTTPLVGFACVAGVIVLQVLLAEVDDEPMLIDVIWAFLLFPIGRAYGDHSASLVIRSVSLVMLAGLALRYRREALRWSSTVLWLFLVPAFADAQVGGHWTSTTYAVAFLVAFGGLVLSRAIARGVIFASSKIPLASYARSASLSYVFGYIAAALLAFGFSLNAVNSQLVTSVVVGLLTACVLFLVKFIEKRPHGLVVLPFMVQILLWSILRPTATYSSLTTFVVLSSALAVVAYWLAQSLAPKIREAEAATIITGSALLSTFVAPAWALSGERIVVAMPVALIVAGIAVSYHVRHSEQNEREVAGSLITLAVLWLLGVLGVHEFQVYVYVVVVMLGLYAYWRTQRGETNIADNYIWWMLGLSTIPLALQALSGQNGGVYGWWFILQQVFTMLLGISISKSFVTRWGLYAAVAAVLFQLRGLGYAALALLAVFLIALAVYRLNKHTDK